MADSFAIRSESEARAMMSPVIFEQLRSRGIGRKPVRLIQQKGSLDSDVERLAQFVGEHRHRGVTHCGILLEAPEDDFFQRERDVWIEFARRDEVRTVPLGVKDTVGRVSGEGFPVGQ